MSNTRRIINISCAKGCLDKTPSFMSERQRLIKSIDSIYKKHDAVKLETPVFELKEFFSNRRNKFDRIMDLDDQGGEILSMRYDLKTSLTRYLAMFKIEKHVRISQFGYVYRKEPFDIEQQRMREFYVSDFDICGPSDSMLTEVQCLRVACEVAEALCDSNESYIIKIGHRKLTECALSLACKINNAESVKLVGKLADENRRSAIDWTKAASVIGDKKITDLVLESFKNIVAENSGDLTKSLEQLESNESLNALKEFKAVVAEMVQLNEYCKALLNKTDYDRLRLDLNLVGPRSYFTGMTFAVWLKNSDKNVLSGGRYDNLIGRICPKSKLKTSCTGFTVGIDQMVMLNQLKNGTMDLLKDNVIVEKNDNEIEMLETAIEKTEIDKKKFVTEKKEEKGDDHKDDNILKNVKGTVDRNPRQMAIREEVFDKIVACFRRHNAETIDTPVVERKDVLTGKYGEDSKLIYDLNSVDNELLSLRYDLTVPFARYLAMHPSVISDNKQFKRYQIGKVYRRDQPAVNSGRYREFYQCDFDIAGGEDLLTPMKTDSQCLTIVHDVLHDLELGDFKIKVNHRLFLDGLFAVCGVPATMFRTVCSSVDKLDKTPWTKVYEEMLEKGLCAEAANKIGQYVTLSGTVSLIDQLETDEQLSANENVRVALKELRQLFGQCNEIMGKVCFDLSLARGLDYYTGMIFEAVFVGFESRTQDGGVNEEDGAISVGSVSGGGRYDNLVNMFSGSETSIPCVGLSIGVERLMAIYERKLKYVTDGSSGVDTDKSGVVMVITAHKNMVEDRLRLLALLLDAGITAVHSLKKQPRALDVFQECNRLNIRWAVVLGEDEMAQGVVTLRNMDSRVEEKVARADIVARLRDVLAR